MVEPAVAQTVSRPAQSRSEGARPGRGLDARERAAALVDDPHLARADDHDHRLPLQRDSVGGQGHASTCGCIPDEDQEKFLDQVRKVINDPKVEVRWARDRYRPAGGSRLNTEAFTVIEAQIKKHYDTVTLPTMGTGATDMSNIRAKGPQCYGIGPATRPARTGRRASARTATRSASWSPSCIASSASSSTWSWSSPAPDREGTREQGARSRWHAGRACQGTLSRCPARSLVPGPWSPSLCLVLAGMSSTPAPAAAPYDLVVANGRVMDPESGLDAVRHVGIRGGPHRGDLGDAAAPARASSTPPATSWRPASSTSTSTASRRRATG